MRIDPVVVDAIAQVAEEELAAWRVPGLALAVVDSSGPRLARGFGRRSLAEDLPVTADTAFAIGSCTKAFTTAAIGVLADDGLLDWDAPVRAVMPEFELADPVASREITLRDMCCHRSGLPAHDLVWYNATLSQAELVRRIRYLEPSRPFRSAYQYSNLMYMAAGQVVARAAGRSWAEVVSERILRPLGMRGTHPSGAGIEELADWARPYTREDDGWRETYRYASSEGRPSGSVHSTARDLATWLAFQLGAAAGSDTAPLLSAGQVANMRTPLVVPEPEAQVPGTPLTAYALGWFVQTYRGHLRVGHSGGVRGYSAMVSFMPDEGIGVAIATNMDGHALGLALQNRVYDLALGLAPWDWTTTFRDLAKGGFVLAQAGAQERVEGTRPSHALGAYAGTYRHPAYGEVEVAVDSDDLTMRFHALTWRARHHHYDQFAVSGEVVESIARFETELDGTVGALSVRLEPNPRVAPIAFRRVSA